MLMASVGQHLFAQNVNFDQQWNQAIEIQLKNNAKAYVVSNATPFFLEAPKYNLDSIVRVALAKYKEIAEETDELASKSVTYHYGSNDKNWKYTLKNPKEGFTVKTYPVNEKRYGIIGGSEFVKLKTTKDTLVINLIFGELPKKYLGKAKIKATPKIGYQLSYGFIVNSFSDLENIDYKAFNSEIETEINKIATKIGYPALLNKPFMPINTLIIDEATDTHLYWNSKVKQISTLTSHVSGGWVRDKFTPEFGFDALIVTKGRTGFGLGINQFFHFTNQPDNTVSVNNSNFINVQVAFLSGDPRKKSNRFTKNLPVGNVSVGYMVDKSVYFPKNTWRLATMYPITKHLAVEAELYFGKLQWYPSIRFRVW